MHKSGLSRPAFQLQASLQRPTQLSRKPDELFDVIDHCSSGPCLELFSRGRRDGWVVWGDQADDDYTPRLADLHPQLGGSAANQRCAGNPPEFEVVSVIASTPRYAESSRLPQHPSMLLPRLP